MIGKPLAERTIEFNNKTPFVLEALTAEGSRFFYGGGSKEPGETADDLRQERGFSVIINPCPGAHDLNAKISSVAVWQTFNREQKLKDQPQFATGLEELLALVSAPGGVVTPSTLRVPRTTTLRGPVFEYVRGDTTEVVSFVNEGAALRVSWASTNTAVCPR